MTQRGRGKMKKSERRDVEYYELSELWMEGMGFQGWRSGYILSSQVVLCSMGGYDDLGTQYQGASRA